ncbi:hypothetical protein FisN_21Lh052 [Fistulifera solaris]|uniref:Golgin-84 n=1 Tax=Fistulifera solaris TaxID=1519565 RepID=A0A1Z5KK57_FISSO|nr:hypothetical protein FisN_21Lh052 [Fistulifera solaris]|eukprot:GAX26587.1 hypothetical protein FisN_21Lh052 [Fistulifera solaris]
MSRWLKSVNNLLDKLDDQVDIADAAAFTQRMAARVGGAVQRTQSDDDDDDDDDDDEEEMSESYDDESMSSFVDDEEEQQVEEELQQQEQETSDNLDTEESLLQRDETVRLRNHPSDPTATPAASSYSYGEDIFFTPMDQIRREHISDIISPPREVVSSLPSSQSVSSHQSDLPIKSDPILVTRTPPSQTLLEGQISQQKLHKPVVKSPPNSGMPSSVANANKSKAIKKLKEENQRLQQLQVALEKSNAELKDELEHARAELTAQHEELQLAADRMEKDRIRNKEDREELLEEQEEELQQQKEDYDHRLAEQKQYYEKELREMRKRLQQEEHKRLEEGGDWTKELEEALQRERDALNELVSVKSEKQQLESKVATLDSQRESLQAKVMSLKESLRNTTERERIAEEKLDKEMNQHKRQLGQQREREEQLERTVAELSAALTSAQQQATSSTPPSVDHGFVAYKERYQNAMEEMEAMKSQLSHVTQQNQILQLELQSMSRERTADAEVMQTRQRKHDEHAHELLRQVAHLEATLRSLSNDQNTTEFNGSLSSPAPQQQVERLVRELEQAQRKLAFSTGQIVELKGLSDSAKAEVLALKGRLQSAMERAEMAENALASQSSSTSRACDMGEASYANTRTVRRRVRSGRGRFSHLSTRSMFSVLGMHVTRGSIGEQISTTIDAIDNWMLETGNILRHEPLARLGFAIYFALVHLWCLGLVFFHTVQSERADLGSLTNHKKHVA